MHACRCAPCWARRQPVHTWPSRCAGRRRVHGCTDMCTSVSVCGRVCVHTCMGTSTCLALLVECHHDNSRAVLLNNLRVLDELLLAALQRDRVDDTLALDTLEACLDNVELRRVDHDRHLHINAIAYKCWHNGSCIVAGPNARPPSLGSSQTSCCWQEVARDEVLSSAGGRIGTKVISHGRVGIR